MQVVRQQLKTFLETGNSMDLFKAEKAMSFTVLFETNNKPFCNVPAERQGELLNSINTLAVRFLQTNFPDINQLEVAMQFSVDLVDMRPDWNLLDVLYFFKFIRQRQDLEETKIFGNAFKITPILLNKLTAVYESEKANARTDWQRQEANRLEHGTQEQRLMLGQNSQRLIGTGEQFKDTRFADLAAHLLAKDKLKVDKVYQRAETTKQWHRDNQFCHNWINSQPVTEQVKIHWMNNFLIRK